MDDKTVRRRRSFDIIIFVAEQQESALVTAQPGDVTAEFNY
jgi:hypothetical protein